eukprot:5608702-Pleurochrysis_carterae.AAC.1
MACTCANLVRTSARLARTFVHSKQPHQQTSIWNFRAVDALDGRPTAVAGVILWRFWQVRQCPSLCGL